MFGLEKHFVSCLQNFAYKEKLHKKALLKTDMNFKVVTAKVSKFIIQDDL